MSAQPLLKTQTITPEEYIETEIASETKHEYLDGEVFAMAGAPARHNIVAGNIFGESRTQLRGTPCLPFNSDQRVKVEADGMRAYPDVSIACEPRFENEKQLDLLNPRVIFEVLSPGTAAYDRGEKFRHYRRIPSLQEYVLVETERPHIEHFIRQSLNLPQAQGGWLLLEYDGLEAELRLSSVPCVLRAAEIYERVVFEEEISSARPTVEDSPD